MGRFQSCKGVVEKVIRRAFYDGVLDLYEANLDDRVVCVALEGSLALTINKCETYTIKLNEVAQRAHDTADDTQEGSFAPGQLKRKNEDPDLEKVAKKFFLKKEIKKEKFDLESSKTVQHPFTVTSEDHADSQSTCPLFSKEVDSVVSANDANHSEACTDSTHAINIPDLLPASPTASKAPDNQEVLIIMEGQTKKTDSKSHFLQGGKQLASRERIRESIKIKQEPETTAILVEDDDTDGNLADDSITSYSRHYSSHTFPEVELEPETHAGDEMMDVSSHFILQGNQSAAVRQMQKHMLQLAMVQERWDCPVCGEVLHTRKILAVHLQAHRHTFRSTCRICRTDNLTLEALLLHMRVVHGPQIFQLPGSMSSAESLIGQAVVPISAYRQGSMSAIASLVNMANSRNAGLASGGMDSAAAFLTSRGAIGMAAATSHMSQVMEQLINYQSCMSKCDFCELLFPSKQDLAVHITTAHGLHGSSQHSTSHSFGSGSLLSEENGDDGIKSESPSSAEYSCFDCSVGFSSLNAFTQHSIQHHNTPAVASQGSCSLCHRTFDTWKILRSHYFVTHGVSTFCDNCKLGLGSTEELKAHCETHAHEARSMAFVCDICNKGFYSQSQCSAHKRSHISEKHFACQVCGSAFFKRGDLSKHFRTVHAPNRVFACRICGKRGTRMDNMRSHVRSHGKHMTRDEILAMIEEVKA